MNLVVIGAQWGDEGKGKIVDFLADHADVVIRYSGGANAGHTIVRGEQTYKLHLVPSGIVYPDKKVLLGSGMVIDPDALFEELRTLTSQGIAWEGRVFVSDRAHIVLPRYREMDKEMDQRRDKPIGTTGRGIGIAYARKSSRDGVRVADVLDQTQFPAFPGEDQEFLEPYREKLEEMAVDLHSYLEWLGPADVLFEGAQGAMLDLDLGTYPFVSSGHSGSAGAVVGGGIGLRQVDRVLGVCKAYSTRVGNGPFPSEFTPERDGDLAETIREIGGEYGVTTGRPRRCGYLDLVALRYTCRANSIDTLALTKLDVYDTMDEVKVCVAYEIDDAMIDYFPASQSALNRAVPVTKRFPGWKSSIRDITNYEELPEAAKDYIAFIEHFTGTSVDIVSVGSDHKHTIVRKDPWTLS